MRAVGSPVGPTGLPDGLAVSRTVDGEQMFGLRLRGLFGFPEGVESQLGAVDDFH